MAFPSAPGTRNIGSDAMKYIPQLWASKLLVKYYDSTVLSVITNTDYEGEIRKMGDTVYIRQRPDMTIRDYVKGQTLVNEQPEAPSVTLKIDQGRYWSFVTEDLDKVQTDLKNFVNEWTSDAAEQLKINIDSTVLGSIPADAGITVDPGAALTSSNVLDYIVDAGTQLDENNVPSTGRFMIIPPWMAGMIKKSDLKDASMTGDSTSVLRNGLIGTIDRFTLYYSNLLAGTGASSSDYNSVLFGTTDATTFATQLTESKVLDNPNGFGMLHRGLQVFGYEVVKPEALGVLKAYKA